MTPELARLHPYPFEKLAKIKQTTQITTDLKAIDLSIGEPKHPAPQFVKQTLIDQIDTLGQYPTTRGSAALRETISQWLIQRFQLPIGSITADNNVLPVNGTREALFAIAQLLIDTSNVDPLVISPNPFYQIYEGAAFLAGADPYYLNCTPESNYLPDFDQVPEEIWQRCQLIFLCSPGNPTGAVIPEETLIKLMQLSDQYDFVIASDECYSEIYFDGGPAPIGLLEAAAKAGRTDYKNCLVFHSLSKRSNVPGLRSGFVAGDAKLIKAFLHYRTYHGCSMPLPTQLASIAAWQDEQHVIENRHQYSEKFHAVIDILSPVLDVALPDAGFYLWPELPIDDEEFAHGLLGTENVTVLPGSYLGREVNGINPGSHRARIALVASLEQTIEAAERIKNYVKSIK